MVKDHKMSPASCPNCGEIHDGALNAEGNRKPKWGDIFICIECHHIGIFDNNLQLRNPTDAEMVDIAGNPAIIRTMRALEQFDEQRQQRAKSTETKPG